MRLEVDSERLFIKIRRLGMCYYQVAELAGVSRKTLYRLLCGGCTTTIPTLECVSTALQCDPRELLSESSIQRYTARRRAADVIIQSQPQT